MAPPRSWSPGKQPSRPSHTEALRIVHEESNRISGWSLLIIGGSLLALLDNNYLKTSGPYRAIYLIYILGWVSLCLSVYWGQRVTRGYLASLFVKKVYLDGIVEQVNLRFRRQINWFICGVMVFAAWMLAYLLLWILPVTP
ncbi:hypothetical protein [Chitinophaga japonensis]|uniref:Uncharacterized protein n=1 Tax=Chitinophaga japonensis TaxID=104662 RepID=A0A562T5W4_CHIJA|nr:hypothetical protein [Chitinophaga japonensis]TWI88929.1 hypothetical protein LX66_3019 [Chitinophaga japonensis]